MNAAREMLQLADACALFARLFRAVFPKIVLDDGAHRLETKETHAGAVDELLMQFRRQLRHDDRLMD